MDTLSLYFSLFRGPYHIWEVKGDVVRYGTRHPAAEAHQKGLTGSRMGIEEMKKRAWDKLGRSREGQQEFFKLIRSCWFKRYAGVIPSRLPQRKFLGLNRADVETIEKKLGDEFKRLTKEYFK
jgi:phage gpG-like protein